MRVRNWEIIGQANKALEQIRNLDKYIMQNTLKGNLNINNVVDEIHWMNKTIHPELKKNEQITENDRSPHISVKPVFSIPL